MKVLIWTQYFWPENFHINAVAAEMVKLGIDVTVLTGKPNYPEGRIFEGYDTSTVIRECYLGCQVIRIPMRVRGSGSAIDLALNYASFIVSGYFVAPFLLRKKEFDAVFVYAPSPLLQALPAILVAWFKSAKLTLWVQDLWPDVLSATGFVSNKLILKIIEIAVRYVYRYSDRILIQSEQFRKSVENLVGDKEKIYYFPNSSESHEDKFPPIVSFVSKERFAIGDYFSIVFAGNIGSAQSCETIVEAAGILRDFPAIKFFLVGSGSASKDIALEIEKNGLTNVIMTGRLPPEEMPRIFAFASVLLLSLKSDPALSATVPSKLQSYMAAGKPIIASLDGEAARLVESSCAGIVCPAGDSKALARAVLELFEMSSIERAKLGTNARAYFAANFDISVRVQELVDYFKSNLFQHKSVRL